MTDQQKTEHDQEDLERVARYVGHVRDAMRMQAWDVNVHPNFPEEHEEAHAETWQENNHQTINIRFGRDLFNQDPEVIRNTVIHELVHAQHRDLSRQWDECVTRNLAVSAEQSMDWTGDFTMFLERFVSWVAQRLEGLEEIPEWPGKKGKHMPVGVRIWRA